MTVQMHLAHSSSFKGAGIIAGGPYRCVESYKSSFILNEDNYVENSIYICLNPLIPETGPRAEHMADLARQTAQEGRIDPVENLKDDRIYIFTGKSDTVVFSDVVKRTMEFYEILGVKKDNIAYYDTIPAGHSIITDNPEDSDLPSNKPPYINNGGFMQSYDILTHIYGTLNPPSERPGGRMIRFDQREFFNNEERASMSQYGYAYVPKSVEDGEPARVHIALHGCKQGYNYVNFVNGSADIENSIPYGNRYYTTTGYNNIADSNGIIVLYPQAEGTDNAYTQNPEGCWDWWGYSSPDADEPDYYSKDAIQIKAIHGMLRALGG
jgi:hypothetical protein